METLQRRRLFLSQLQNFGSGRYAFSTLGCCATVWRLAPRKGDGFGTWHLTHKQPQTVLSQSSINHGCVAADASLTSRLIKRTPDNAYYKGQSSYHTRGTLAHLSGGTRLLCDLVVHRRALCMLEPRIKTDGTWGNYSIECGCLLWAANSKQISITVTCSALTGKLYRDFCDYALSPLFL